MCVRACMYVNQSGTNHNRCTYRDWYSCIRIQTPQTTLLDTPYADFLIKTLTSVKKFPLSGNSAEHSQDNSTPIFPYKLYKSQWKISSLKIRYVTDSESESDGIWHFFPKSEIRRIPKIRSCQIRSFCVGPTLHRVRKKRCHLIFCRNFAES